MTSNASTRPGTGDFIAVSEHFPPPWLEYFYYAQIVYSILGAVVGLSIPAVGSLAMAFTGAICVMRAGRYSAAMLAPVAMPLACAGTFVAIQMGVHGESLTADYVREFIPWAIGIIVVQSLAVRPGFLHRAAAVMFVIALATLPYMRAFANDTSRTGLEKGIGSISNPNDLAAWFGFCCVYCAIQGLETRRHWIRALSWLIAGGCVIVIGLTVSRLPLFAVACSLAFAFKRVLRRGFLPVFALLFIGWVAYTFGVFDREATMYAKRGLEDSGRLSIWPIAINRFVQSPFGGVGVSHLATPRGPGYPAVTPHNGFIFIGLAAGVVPLLLFIAYWVRLLFAVVKVNAQSHEDSAFHAPLLLYSFMITMNLNEAFMLPWMMVVLGTVGATGFLATARQALEYQRRGPRPFAGSIRPLTNRSGA